MAIQIIYWTATIASLLGQVLINNKKKSAFYVWAISNLLWIAVNVIGTFNIANVVMYIVYTIMNVHGIYKWNKGEHK